MTAPEVELRTTWQRMPGAADCAEVLDGLLGRLREPHRHYHSATHVMWVLRHVEALLPAADPRTDGDAVRLAALYHDAAYDPRASDNEAVSAKLARSVAEQLGWPQPRADLVHALVLATALGGEVPRRDEPDHDAYCVLLDADLAILGAEPNDYRAYVNGVRREYAHVSDDDWRTGRSAVLRHLLDLDPLYRSDTMRRARMARARANMAAELATLGQ
jgi:predicted metal-dependent HD superfamily phosphohydrolase